MDEEGKIEKFRKQDDFWVGIIQKYEERNAELEQEQRALQSKVDQMEASMPAVMAYNMVKLANEKPSTDVDKLITAPPMNAKDSSPRKPLKMPDLSNISVFSIQDADLRYMDRIKQLTEQEKKLINDVNRLRGKEKVLRDNKKKVDNIMGVPHSGGMKALVDGTDLQKMNEKLLDENRRLSDEIADLKLELKHNRETVEGPMSRELDRERRRAIKLEGELKEKENQEKHNNSGAKKEIDFLKEQLRSGAQNLKDMADINDKLKDEVNILSKRIDELQNDLINQKLSEANSLAILKAQLEKCKKNPPSSGGAPPGAGPGPGPGPGPAPGAPPDGPSGGDKPEKKGKGSNVTISGTKDVSLISADGPSENQEAAQPEAENEALEKIEPEKESPASGNDANKENDLYKIARDLSNELKTVPESAKVPEDLKGTVAGIRNICDVLGKSGEEKPGAEKLGEEKPGSGKPGAEKPKGAQAGKRCICGDPDPPKSADKIAIREDEVPVKEPREGSTEEVQAVTNLDQPEMVVVQNDDGANITTMVTHDGYLEVTTQGPAGVIETTMAVTKSGHVEVVTEYSEAEPKYQYHPEGSQDNAFFRKAIDLDDPGGTPVDKEGDSAHDLDDVQLYEINYELPENDVDFIRSGRIGTDSTRKNSAEALHFLKYELVKSTECVDVSESFEEMASVVPGRSVEGLDKVTEDHSSTEETELIEVVILVDRQSTDQKANIKFLDAEGHLVGGDTVMIEDNEDRTVYETTIEIPLSHDGSDAVLNWEDMECRVDILSRKPGDECGSVEEVASQVAHMLMNKITAVKHQRAKSSDVLVQRTAAQVHLGNIQEIVLPALATTVIEENKRVINISYTEGTYQATVENVEDDVVATTSCSPAISQSKKFFKQVKSFKVLRKRRQQRRDRRRSYKRRSYEKKELQIIHYSLTLNRAEIEVLEQAHTATVQFLQQRKSIAEAYTKKAVLECVDSAHIAVEQVFREDIVCVKSNEHFTLPPQNELPLNEEQLSVYFYNDEDLEGGMYQRMSFLEKGDTEVNEKSQQQYTELCRRPTAPCELPTIHSESEIQSRHAAEDGKLDHVKIESSKIQKEQAHNVSNKFSEEAGINISAESLKHDNIFDEAIAEIGPQLPNDSVELSDEKEKFETESTSTTNSAQVKNDQDIPDLMNAVISENLDERLPEDVTAPLTTKHLVNMEALSSIQAILKQEMQLLEDHNHQFMQMQKTFNECSRNDAIAEHGCFSKEVIHIATDEVLPLNTIEWRMETSILSQAESKASIQEEMSELPQIIGQDVAEEDLLENCERQGQFGLQEALQVVESKNSENVIEAKEIDVIMYARQKKVEMVNDLEIFRDEDKQEIEGVDNLGLAANLQTFSAVEVEFVEAVSLENEREEESNETETAQSVLDVLDQIIGNLADISASNENPVEYVTQGTQTYAPRLEKILEVKESEEDREEIAVESNSVVKSVLDEIIEKVCTTSEEVSVGNLKDERREEIIDVAKSSAMVTKILSIVSGKLHKMESLGRENVAVLDMVNKEDSLRVLVDEDLVGLIDFEDKRYCNDEEEWHDAEEGGGGDEEYLDSINEFLEGKRSSCELVSQSEMDILQPKPQTNGVCCEQFLTQMESRVEPKSLRDVSVPSDLELFAAMKRLSGDECPALTSREALRKNAVQIRSTSTMTQSELAILNPTVAEGSKDHRSTCECIDCITETVLEDKESSDSSATCGCVGPCVCCARKTRSDRTLKQRACYCNEQEVQGLISAGDRSGYSKHLSNRRTSTPTEAGEGSKLHRSSEEFKKLLDEGNVTSSTVCLFKTPPSHHAVVYVCNAKTITDNDSLCNCSEDYQEPLSNAESEYSCVKAANEKEVQTATCSCVEPTTTEDKDLANTLAGKTPDLSESDCCCAGGPSTTSVAKNVTEIQGLIDKIACACKEAETVRKMSTQPVFRGEQICDEAFDELEEDLLPEPHQPIDIFRPSPTMLPRFGQLPAPCYCTTEVQAADCECTVDPKPLKIRGVKQVGPKSVLVKWVASDSHRILGYEICVNDLSMSRVYNRLRTSAVLDCLIPSAVNKICIYGVEYNGRCYPPALAEFKIC